MGARRRIRGGRSGVVLARGCAETRRLFAKPNRQGDGSIARGLLTHSRRDSRPASAALGRLARVD
jgi:hypothetical protein